MGAPWEAQPGSPPPCSPPASPSAPSPREDWPAARQGPARASWHHARAGPVRGRRPGRPALQPAQGRAGAGALRRQPGGPDRAAGPAAGRGREVSGRTEPAITVRRPRQRVLPARSLATDNDRRVHELPRGGRWVCGQGAAPSSAAVSGLCSVDGTSGTCNPATHGRMGGQAAVASRAKMGFGSPHLTGTEPTPMRHPLRASRRREGGSCLDGPSRCIPSAFPR